MDHTLAELDAPLDPRSAWDLPPVGALPPEADLDELTSRVLAPNPSMLALDGTNTYVIGAGGAGEAMVVDPGPDDPGHRQRVDDVLARRDAQAVAVLTTHHHPDHAEAAATWARSWGCALWVSRADIGGEDGRVLQDGQRLDLAGTTIDAVATPGHCADHIAFRLANGALLTGDHILGRGTSVVAAPDGDLLSYLASLRRVLELGPDALYPGHGPELVEDDPSEVVRFYLEHRAFREEQIIALLSERPHHTSELVRRIYADVDRQLWPAAASSTRAALEKMQGEGIVEVDRGGTARLSDD